MPSGKARAGALVARPIATPSVARFPWFQVILDEPMEIMLAAGDGVAVDEQRQLFQHRRSATDGVVRTISNRFDFLVNAADHELELEFRLPSGLGPEIFLERRSLSFRRKNFLISPEGMFQRLCAALASPVWNPFDYRPDASQIETHKADFEARILLGPNGGPLKDDVVKDLPPDMEVRLAEAVFMGSGMGSNPILLPAGVYRARPDNGRESPHVRLDSREGDALAIDKAFVALDDFIEGIAQGDVVVLAEQRWEQFPLWEYSI